MGVITRLVTSFLVLVSSAAACDRCLHETNVTSFSDVPRKRGCWFGSQAKEFNGGRFAGSLLNIYDDGDGIDCGSCFQVRCKDEEICSEEGTTIIVTDTSDETDFVLSKKAFKAMAKKGSDKKLLKHKYVKVEYTRIPCDYGTRNMSVRVEKSSNKENNNLAIQVLYQEGQTNIWEVQVASVESTKWMKKKYGTVWEAKVPKGALKFAFMVTNGYDVQTKWYTTNYVMPANWTNEAVYDLGIQITDIAQEFCYNCNPTIWKPKK